MEKKFKGFTLIELIIVIAVIALLAAATFVAINPAKRVGDAQDAQRWQDVTAIADAYQAYLADNSGTAVTTTAPYQAGRTMMIASGTPGVKTPAGCNASLAVHTLDYFIDLSGLVSGGYIGQIPVNPSYTTGSNTLYYFYRDSVGKLIIGSCTKYGTNYPTAYR